MTCQFLVNVIPIANNRDLRRTWKTLAGKAGVSKEIRDRIQNHALHDASSKSYDRRHQITGAVNPGRWALTCAAIRSSS